MAGVRPAAADLEALLRDAGADGGQREASGVERREGDAQALPFLADEILARYAHVAKADDAVRERLETHEVTAVLDLHARPIGVDDEGADLLRRGVARHHDEELGERAVGAPELLAVQQKHVAVTHRRRGEARRIGADVRLGEGKGGDRTRRAAWQIFLFLLRGAEELQRLRHPDRLVRGEERADVVVGAADHLHDLAVLRDREAEPAVLLRDLHPEGAELAEPVDDVVGVLARLVDRDAVDLFAQEGLELVVEHGELRALPVVHRKGMDERQEEVPEEDLA